MTRPERTGGARPLGDGDRVGSYVLTGHTIGSGGFGQVHEATQPQLGLRVAIKIQDGYGNPIASERALREAKALAKIQHRNVVRIFDAGELDDGRHYLAMELLSGDTLRAMLANEPLPRDRALAFLVAIAGALDAIHARGIVHRDLKPSNVFVCRDDDGELYPKLIDFGIAKDLAMPPGSELTQSGALVGTPSYMSPEQCAGAGVVDARSDIYALGVLAYHMLAGRPPFAGASAIDVAHQQLHAPVPPITEGRPDLPPALDAVFARILAKAPDARPASAGAAVELLVSAFDGTHAALNVRDRRRVMPWLVAVLVIALAVPTGLVVVSKLRVNGEQTLDAVQTPIPEIVLDATVSLPVDAAPAPDAAPRPRPPPPRRPDINDVEGLPGR